MFKTNEPQELDDYFNRIIKEYNLEKCSIKAKDRISRVGYDRRKDNFNKFRADYNNSTERDYRQLFLLSCYSINHLIRFNQKSEFNASSGADSYNEKNYKMICDTHEQFKDIEILEGDAFDFDFEILTQDSFVYCDVPYLNTEAVYNEKRAFGGWSIEDDYKLFKILEQLNSKGIKWGLSNVFENRGVKNEHLIKWCKENNWAVTHLDRNYNPFSRGNSNNDEVFICNYRLEEYKMINLLDNDN